MDTVSFPEGFGGINETPNVRRIRRESDAGLRARLAQMLAAKDLVLVGVLGAVAGAVCMVISLLCGMSPVTNPLPTPS